MSRHFRNRFSISAAMLMGSSFPAAADVTISSAATQAMNCSGGVCAPTAATAVLNVNDLQSLLTSGSVRVTTTGSGVQASSLRLAAKFSWSSANSLALDAYKSAIIDKPVEAKGTGGLSVLTSDGGHNGELSFGAEGRVTLANLSSPLTINGVNYSLVSSISSLASAIAANPAGAFALRESYDAGQDGTYTVPPISTIFTGSFNGLGNTISNLTINDPTEDSYVGLFGEVSGNAILANLKLQNENVTGGFGSSAQASTEFVGGLIGFGNSGTISDVSASGSVASGEYSAVGGLVGISGNIIEHCKLSMAVSNGVMGEAGGLAGGTNPRSSIAESSSAGSVSGDVFIGGLAGFNAGTIEHSFATGAVTGTSTDTYAGGLVGMNQETIVKSSASGAVSCEFACGGLVGINGGGPGAASVSQSYAMGDVSASAGAAGGLVGYNELSAIADSYATGSAFAGGSGYQKGAGGLIGNNYAGEGADGIMRSYSSGVISAPEYAGGLIGYDQYSSTINRAYWDLTTSGITNKAQGAGNVPNDPGIKGLSDTELKSGLPKGFNPRVWAENPVINSGLPYLIANPPRD